ncbi:F-box/LRR-repeat protein At3g26922-like isoform X1 [Coffea eugenioides]|uniref:F-box/LRR-repeat protein At3g26922-like isoform X1 n=1 Tax=Coffea eugenioides TaxID=49369 RepID=UPI000F60C820|nr:F-box/LRR-repeat protein At3g26922-like isoform X1 [Coffea eugenioides]
MDKELTNLSSNKKLRRPNDSLEDDDDVDRISDLPESVLSHILSRLPTTLDAVRTCVLSRKWEKQWKNVYNLRFSDYKVDKSKKKDFAISVQKVLYHFRNSRIQGFMLSINCNQYNPTLVKTWLSAALRSNVQRLCFSHVDDLEFPHYFFECDSLVHLVLELCTFRVPGYFCLANLRVLNFYNVTWQNDDCSASRCFILNFPVLEVFKSYQCRWLNVKMLKILAPLLASFQMVRSFLRCTPGRSEDCEIEICGDNLSYFNFDGFSLENIVLSNPSKVANVCLDVNSMERFIQRGKIGSRALLLLGGLSSVIRCLELSEYVIEALAHAEPPCSLPIFDGLTILKVSSTWSNTLCSGPLMELLNSAPALEKLIFTTLIDDVNYEESNSLPTNFSSNLKVVEFRLFKGRASEIQLVKFLLHNLSILEQLVITKFLGDTKVEVENQLLMLPRSSSRVSIVFL